MAGSLLIKQKLTSANLSLPKLSFADILFKARLFVKLEN